MQSLDSLVTQGAGDDAAISIGDGIYMSRGIANSYLIQTSEGDVMINAGLHFESPQIKERFAAISQGPLRAIVFTQGHPDHVYGWSDFNGPGVETIAQKNHTEVREYWHNLHPFFVRRIMKLWGQITGDMDVMDQPPEPVLTASFLDAYAFELGGRKFELYATPGGEATDALVVWLPQSKTLLVGNLMGPMFGHVPNLYTIRGDKIRSAIGFIRAMDRIIDLAPEILINGHDVFRGADQIRTVLTQVRDATKYLREKTIAGMNAGRDIWTLMREVTLPRDLSLPETHGKVSWIVRAIWEEHAGWFRYESTTELYDVPAAAIWGDIVELAGPGLRDRARDYVSEAKPLQALHLIDMILSQSPGDRSALELKRAALQQISDASGGVNFSENHWLGSEIALVENALATAAT